MTQVQLEVAPDGHDSASPESSELDAGLFRTVKPYLAASAVIVTGAMLTAAIAFTLLDLAWIAFLSGILVASILAMATQAARSEMSSASLTRKLVLVEYRLAKESAIREHLEKQLAAVTADSVPSQPETTGGIEVPDRAGDKESKWLAASRSILAAINGNEFALMGQRIVPLSGDSATVPEHREVLIRLLEEESGLVPPGAFFPLAEEHGLLPQLDRWVVSHTLDWIVASAGTDALPSGRIHFLNVSRDTIADASFPGFVGRQLSRTGVAGGRVCFEVSESDLALNPEEAVPFAESMKQLGCRVAISGFGRNQAAMETLKRLSVDFLKIDGGIVRQLLTYPASLAQAAAIVRLARTLGLDTIAEMVEDEPTMAKVRELKVDFAQGFGISRPRALGNVPAQVNENP